MKRTSVGMVMLAGAGAGARAPGAPAGAEPPPGPALESDPVVLETSLDCPEGFAHPEIAVATIDAATNIAVQDLCPGRVVDHVGLVFGAVALDLVLDALTRPGGADAARVGKNHCADVFASEINPVVATAPITTLYADALAAVPTGPQVDSEPPLRAFAQTG